MRDQGGGGGLEEVDQRLLDLIGSAYNITPSGSMLYFLDQALHHRNQSVQHFVAMWKRCVNESDSTLAASTKGK